MGITPMQGLVGFFGVYILLVGVLRLWSHWVARHAHQGSVQRRLRRFNAMMYGAHCGAAVVWGGGFCAGVADAGEPGHRPHIHWTLGLADAGVADWIAAGVFGLDGFVVGRSSRRIRPCESRTFSSSLMRTCPFMLRRGFGAISRSTFGCSFCLRWCRCFCWWRCRCDECRAASAGGGCSMVELSPDIDRSRDLTLLGRRDHDCGADDSEARLGD